MKKGVRKSTVQRIEDGKFVSGCETLLSLVSVLGLSMAFQSRTLDETTISN
ncbi:MAG: hypothetical protein SVT56_04545 [Chloroflexota bacterium]|nr:hypothetical protein [Chloroflexota bacterium]